MTDEGYISPRSGVTRKKTSRIIDGSACHSGLDVPVGGGGISITNMFFFPCFTATVGGSYNEVGVDAGSGGLGNCMMAVYSNDENDLPYRKLGETLSVPMQAVPFFIALVAELIADTERVWFVIQCDTGGNNVDGDTDAGVDHIRIKSNTYGSFPDEAGSTSDNGTFQYVMRMRKT